jgi:hypothetical protein
MDREPALTGQALRAWRRAWGLSIRAAAPYLGFQASALGLIERGARAVPADVAAFVRAHPAPAADPTYPPTPAGLRAAMAALGLGYQAFARWFGGVGPMGVWHWRHGGAALRVDVAAWLRAGAPRTGRLQLGAAGASAPQAPSRRRPGRDWIWLGEARGWAPPPGVCRPGETFGALIGCRSCAYRVDCAALSRQERAS